MSLISVHWLKLWLGATTLAGICLSSTACLVKTETPLRVGIHVWPGYESLFLAQEKDFFKEAEIRFIELPAASESIRAFENGNVDVVLLTLDEVLRLADRGHEPRIILVMDYSKGADVILSQTNLKSLHELKGRTVGVEMTALGAYVLARALEKAELRPDDVKVVQLLITETETAFLTRKVDAVVTFEPHRTRLLAAGAHTLFDSSQIPNEIVDVMVVRKSLLDDAPPALFRLVGGHFRALEFLRQNRPEAADIMARREGISRAEFLHALELLHQPGQDENRALLNRNGYVLSETMRHLSGVMRRYGMLQTEPDLTVLCDDRFVGNLQP